MPRQSDFLRRSAGLVLTGILSLSLLGCAGAESPAPQDGMLVIRDGALRAPDAECSGSAGLIFAHAGATLTAKDDSGAVVLQTPLPAGRMLRSDSKDYGEAKRLPSFCTFAFPAEGLIDGQRYHFEVDTTDIGSATFTRDETGVGSVAYPPLGDTSDFHGDTP